MVSFYTAPSFCGSNFPQRLLTGFMWCKIYRMWNLLNSRKVHGSKKVGVCKCLWICVTYTKTNKILDEWCHDDVIKWKHFPRHWPLWGGGGIHRSPVNSPHKGQWGRALIFSMICASTNGWVNNRDAGDLRCHRTIMTSLWWFRSNFAAIYFRCWMRMLSIRMEAHWRAWYNKKGE